jgi:hypothetical protein
MISIRMIVGDRRLGIMTHSLPNKIEDSQKTNELSKTNREYPRMPSGFGCYVCGSYFETNEERLKHLEEFKHMDLYNTASPQEREEVHRLSSILSDSMGKTA